MALDISCELLSIIIPFFLFIISSEIPQFFEIINAIPEAIASEAATPQPS